LPAFPGGPEPAPPAPAGIRRVLEDVYRGEPWDLPALRSVLDRADGREGDRQNLVLTARTHLAAWRLIGETPVGQVEAHERLAKLLGASERPEEAIPHLEALTRLAPSEADHWRHLAKRLQDAGAGARAIAAWTGLLAVAPDDLQAHANLARLHAGEGQHGQAAIHFRAEAHARSEDAKAWRRLGACLGQAGDIAGEFDALARALEIDGSQSKVKARVAVLQGRLKPRAAGAI
jgi:Flp pilus assembly protein TadD